MAEPGPTAPLPDFDADVLSIVDRLEESGVREIIERAVGENVDLEVGSDVWWPIFVDVSTDEICTNISAYDARLYDESAALAYRLDPAPDADLRDAIAALAIVGASERCTNDSTALTLLDNIASARMLGPGPLVVMDLEDEWAVPAEFARLPVTLSDYWTDEVGVRHAMFAGLGVVVGPNQPSTDAIDVLVLSGEPGNSNFDGGAGFVEPAEIVEVRPYGGDEMVLGDPDVGDVVAWFTDPDAYAYGWVEVAEPADRDAMLAALGAATASPTTRPTQTTARPTQTTTQPTSEVYYSVGDSGDDVQTIQQELIERGYSVGADGADGHLGPNTSAALKAFQRDQGLPQTGVIDVATIEALGFTAS